MPLGQIHLDPGNRIVGRIVDTKNVPLAGAHVLLRARSFPLSPECMTDEDGYFALDGIPSNNANLRLMWQQIPADPVPVEQCFIRGLELVIDRGPYRYISGTVFDDDSSLPLTDYWVQLLYEVERWGLDSAWTAEAGSRILDLEGHWRHPHPVSDEAVLRYTIGGEGYETKTGTIVVKDTIHEDVSQTLQLGSCWCFADVGPAGDLGQVAEDADVRKVPTGAERPAQPAGCSRHQGAGAAGAARLQAAEDREGRAEGLGVAQLVAEARVGADGAAAGREDAAQAAAAAEIGDVAALGAPEGDVELGGEGDLDVPGEQHAVAGTGIAAVLAAEARVARAVGDVADQLLALAQGAAHGVEGLGVESSSPPQSRSR